MSYFADHLAWQQRVAQEFKAQSSTLDNQMYQMQNGQWYNYPDLINYLKQSQKAVTHQNMTRSFGDMGLNQPGSVPGPLMADSRNAKTKQGFNEDTQSYGYAPKSKILYTRPNGNKRSKTNTKAGKSLQVVGPYQAPSQTGSRFDKQSTLSKSNMKRFNEEVPECGPKSQISRSQYSKPLSGKIALSQQIAKSQVSQQQKQNKKMKIYQAVEKLDDQDIDKISVIIDKAEVAMPEEVVEAHAEEQDQVGELPEGDRLTSVSQLKPSPSQLSGMSGRTYISELQKQLTDEKNARVKLEYELDELKKISSEITSQLSQIQKEQRMQ